MSETRTATIRLTVSINFEDDERVDLGDLARDQLLMDAPSDWEDSIEIEKIWIEPQEPSNG